MDNILDQLDRLGNEIKQAQKQRDQAVGAQNMLLESIQKSFDARTPEELKAKIEEAKVKLDLLAVQIEQEYKELEDNYSW